MCVFVLHVSNKTFFYKIANFREKDKYIFQYKSVYVILRNSFSSFIIDASYFNTIKNPMYVDKGITILNGNKLQ